MKIIEKKDYNDWQHNFTCKRCESKLAAEPPDLHGVYHEGWSDPRDNSGQAAYWTYDVKCAVCNEVHAVEASVIPKALQHVVQERSRRVNNNFYDR